MEYHNDVILRMIDFALGRTLKIDRNKETTSQGNFAYIYVRDQNR